MELGSGKRGTREGALGSFCNGGQAVHHQLDVKEDIRFSMTGGSRSLQIVAILLHHPLTEAMGADMFASLHILLLYNLSLLCLWCDWGFDVQSLLCAAHGRLAGFWNVTPQGCLWFG